jgi:hypothetical protein
MKRIATLMTLVAAMAAASHAGTLLVQFSLTPADGILAGQAGTAVGWGYTITVSDPNTYVAIESITFSDPTPVGSFDDTIGVSADLATEGSPIVVPWQVGLSGLQYNINAGAVFGASTQGLMTLTYDTYSDSGMTNGLDFGLTVDVPAEVYVNQAASVSTPEPGAFGLLGLGLLVIGRVRAHYGRWTVRRD